MNSTVTERGVTVHVVPDDDKYALRLDDLSDDPKAELGGIDTLFPSRAQAEVAARRIARLVAALRAREIGGQDARDMAQAITEKHGGTFLSAR